MIVAVIMLSTAKIEVSTSTEKCSGLHMIVAVVMLLTAKIEVSTSTEKCSGQVK